MTVILSAALAALLAGGFALAGTRMGRRGEDSAWLRAQRLEAATDLLQAVDQFAADAAVLNVTDPGAGATWAMSRMPELASRHSAKRLILVGSDETERLVKQVLGAAGRFVQPPPGVEALPGIDLGQARTEFIAHVRGLVH